MIYQLKKTTSTGLEEATKLCRDLVSARVEAHFSGVSFDVSGWFNEQTDGDFAKPNALDCIPAVDDYETWIAVMMALMPHVQPNFFESIILEHLPNGGDFSEIGGVKATNHRGMLPTG